MELTLEMANEMMRENGGSLNLSGTPITSLPENLTVGGWLDLSGTPITSLPENLTVGGSLNLRGTPIKNQTVKRLKNGDYAGQRQQPAGYLKNGKRNFQDLECACPMHAGSAGKPANQFLHASRQCRHLTMTKRGIRK